MYKFYYKLDRLGSRWKSESVIGHKHHRAQNKMVLYFNDGIAEIANWDRHYFKLGPDWKLHCQASKTG